MYLSCSWTLSLWSWVVGVELILAFFIGCLTALPGVVGDHIRFVRIVCCSGVLGSSFCCGVFGGVCCYGVLGGCTWVLQDFQRIAAFKRVVVDSKFVESSCLIFSASVVMAVIVCPIEKHIVCSRNAVNLLPPGFRSGQLRLTAPLSLQSFQWSRTALSCWLKELLCRTFCNNYSQNRW